MAQHYKYVLVNDRIEDTLAEIRKIIGQEISKEKIK